MTSHPEPPRDAASPPAVTSEQPPGARIERPVRAQLEIQFTSQAHKRGFVSSFANLLSSACEGCLTIDVDGLVRDDLLVDEIVERLHRDRLRSLQFESSGGGGTFTVQLAANPGSPTATLSLPLVVDGQPTGSLWLQADHRVGSPLTLLAVPHGHTALCIESLHPIVALAARVGGLASAALRTDAEQRPRARWTVTPEEGLEPVVGTHDETVWHAVERSEGDSNGAVAWFETNPPRPVQLPSPDWWVRLEALIATAGDSPSELVRHLGQVLPTDCRWRLGTLTEARRAQYVTAIEDGLVAALVPSSEEIVLAIDLEASPDVSKSALLHGVAHLALRHVVPGDAFGHWDTTTTVTAQQPHRQWDREVRDYLAKHLSRLGRRRVETLDDCTPREKAQLGLWRMIGEMLGESRRLHPAAHRYQKAAYQRQAAQRLVGMLEEFDGGMLCDGVGLGKTYVATTLIVHYTNEWRERWAATPERLLEDPFRVSVLAPNSVVSTWRREALPGLSAFGVSLSTIRVISHTKLSRMLRSSEILEAVRGGASDLQHLLLSDLVVVDEAHNFRTLAARRTKVLRDLLRLQPRRDVRRRVALLTATPVNNSLEDLRQELSLLFSKPLWVSDARTDEGYRRQAVAELGERCRRARRTRSGRDVSALVVHGDPEARFTDTIEFRDDLDFGPNVQRIGDYVREQDRKLKDLQQSIRTEAAQGIASVPEHRPVRIAEELLDRVVVQRSRVLCKEIERQMGSTVRLLFRPDAGTPEQLRYADEYDGIEDVLKRFLPLFDGEEIGGSERVPPLSLKVYMWYDVREGIKTADETSSVVGLQRILVLKRLESSPVSFLGTLLRLAVLHAYRLHQLADLCLKAGDRSRHRTLESETVELLGAQTSSSMEKIRSLATGGPASGSRSEFLRALSAAYVSAKPAADSDDGTPQLSLFEDESDDGEAQDARQQLDRLWGLREHLLTDFGTLLGVVPPLADIVFGKFARAEWPHRFIAGGESVDWPRSSGWGLRLITDPKIRALVARLLLARRAGQRAIVFSQFSDTIAYVQSVLRATEAFDRSDWQIVRRGLGVDGVTDQEIAEFRDATVAVTGDTEGRDEIINAFAPFYRIGPFPPAVEEATESERQALLENWQASWEGALKRPIDVLLSSDVLAEGVNLQDASLLVNFDIHWNPVRMIQRSGRIDRRLNPRIEDGREFPQLASIAGRLGRPVPTYFWHSHPTVAPVSVNMILPDELEAELLLRERIAAKTLAIDFTLGLEQGTGAEAAWMANYKYHGISSLNSMQRDRAIEQLASHHERLLRGFSEAGMQTGWVENLNGWFRTSEADQGSPLVARAMLGRQGGELECFRRYLEPAVVSEIPYWYWAEKRPGESMFDGWLVLDGRTWPPPAPRRDIPWHDNVAGPVKASHLLAAVEGLECTTDVEEWSKANKGVGRLLLQGASAIAAPKFGEDRHVVRIANVFVVQAESFEPELRAEPGHTPECLGGRRRGTSRVCGTCGHPPGMHKCCPRCKATADGEEAIEHVFGFRTIVDTGGAGREVPQPWCRRCRSNAPSALTGAREARDDGAGDAE